jgi:peptide deformylase
MAIFPIIRYPNNLLYTKCKEVVDFTPEIREIIEDLKDTMIYNKGLGLACPQIGGDLRIFVANLGMLKIPESQEEIDNPPPPMVFCNPEIIDSKGPDKFKEACLSIAGIQAEVERFSYVKIRAQDEHGQVFEYEAQGYEASVLQHELDHLDGILIFQRVSNMQRRKLEKKHVKMQRGVKRLKILQGQI